MNFGRDEDSGGSIFDIGTISFVPGDPRCKTALSVYFEEYSQEGLICNS
jgi:hypothetical protein